MARMEDSEYQLQSSVSSIFMNLVILAWCCVPNGISQASRPTSKSSMFNASRLIVFYSEDITKKSYFPMR